MVTSSSDIMNDYRETMKQYRHEAIQKAAVFDAIYPFETKFIFSPKTRALRNEVRLQWLTFVGTVEVVQDGLDSLGPKGLSPISYPDDITARVIQRLIEKNVPSCDTAKMFTVLSEYNVMTDAKIISCLRLLAPYELSYEKTFLILVASEGLDNDSVIGLVDVAPSFLYRMLGA